MQKHNDRHEVLKEATEDLATTARKQFSNIIFGGDTSKEARNSRKSFTESMLDEVNADFKKSQAEWIEERKALHEEIKQKEEEREKLRDQISDVGVKHYQRQQAWIKERATASKIAEEHAALLKAAQNSEKLVADAVKIAVENAALRKVAEHNEGVDRGNQVTLKALRDLLSGARKERDAAVLENQNLKRKREVSTSPPPPPVKLLTRPQGTASVQQTVPSPVRAESSPSKQPAPKKSRNRKER
jgi:hypothetical protein